MYLPLESLMSCDVLAMFPLMRKLTMILERANNPELGLSALSVPISRRKTLQTNESSRF